MLVIVVPLLVAVVGLLVFVLARPPSDLKTLGLVLFAVGAFWAVAVLQNERKAFGRAPARGGGASQVRVLPAASAAACVVV